MNERNHIDDLFKSHQNEFDQMPSEQLWDRLTERLDAQLDSETAASNADSNVLEQASTSETAPPEASQDKAGATKVQPISNRWLRYLSVAAMLVACIYATVLLTQQTGNKEMAMKTDSAQMKKEVATPTLAENKMTEDSESESEEVLAKTSRSRSDLTIEEEAKDLEISEASTLPTKRNKAFKSDESSINEASDQPNTSIMVVEEESAFDEPPLSKPGANAGSLPPPPPPPVHTSSSPGITLPSNDLLIVDGISLEDEGSVEFEAREEVLEEVEAIEEGDFADKEVFESKEVTETARSLSDVAMPSISDYSMTSNQAQPLIALAERPSRYHLPDAYGQESITLNEVVTTKGNRSASSLQKNSAYGKKKSGRSKKAKSTTMDMDVGPLPTPSSIPDSPQKQLSKGEMAKDDAYDTALSPPSMLAALSGSWFYASSNLTIVEEWFYPTESGISGSAYSQAGNVLQMEEDLSIQLLNGEWVYTVNDIYEDGSTYQLQMTVNEPDKIVWCTNDNKPISCVTYQLLANGQQLQISFQWRERAPSTITYFKQ